MAPYRVSHGLLFYCGELRGQIGPGETYRLARGAMEDSVRLNPHWRDEADTIDQLFINYCAAVDVIAVKDVGTGDWLLSRRPWRT